MRKRLVLIQWGAYELTILNLQICYLGKLLSFKGSKSLGASCLRADPPPPRINKNPDPVLS